MFTISWSGNSTFPKNLHVRILIFISACNVFCSKKVHIRIHRNPAPKVCVVQHCIRLPKVGKKCSKIFGKNSSNFELFFRSHFSSSQRRLINYNVSTQTNSTEIASKRINFAKFNDFYKLVHSLVWKRESKRKKTSRKRNGTITKSNKSFFK